MTAKPGTTLRFIIPAAISRGRSGNYAMGGCLMTRAITLSLFALPTVRAMYRNPNPIAAGFPVSPDSIKSLSISPRDLDDQTENLCRGLRPWQRRKRRLVTPALARRTGPHTGRGPSFGKLG